MKKMPCLILLSIILAVSAAAAGCTRENSGAASSTAAQTATASSTAAAAAAEETITAAATEEAIIGYPSLEPSPLDGKTCVNDQIDQDSLYTNVIDFFEDGAYEHLFDGVYTEEDWAKIPEGDTSVGKCGFYSEAGNFFFAMNEKVKLSAYVIYTCNDSALRPGLHPIEWTLYGSNTPFETDGSADPLEDDSWTVLDFVYDGGLPDADFTPVIYTIDQDRQNEYQYYCWAMSYGRGTVQMNEMLFYID